MIDEQKTIGILLDVYAYNYAFTIAQAWQNFPKEAFYLLELMKERRELNVAFLFDHQKENEVIGKEHNLKLKMNQKLEDEQIANYILDLEVKIKNGEIIDFVRSVSPILYRLFLRLIKSQMTDFDTFIIDAKNDQYDSWDFAKMKAANNPIFETYLSKRQSHNITTKSLADLLKLSQLPAEIKTTVDDLRKFEKSVRNPLAHLIKPFDEEELHRTTQFSSQAFLDKIIELASFSGVIYQREPFLCDQVNDLIVSLLENKKER